MFLERIGQVAIFLICAQTLVHFRAKECYEKYIKLLVSMMLLILLMEPILNLFHEKVSIQDGIKRYEQELEGVLSTSYISNEEIEQRLIKMIEHTAEEGYLQVQQESRGEESKAEIETDRTQIIIKSIEIGDNNGESAESIRKVSSGQMVSER